VFIMGKNVLAVPGKSRPFVCSRSLGSRARLVLPIEFRMGTRCGRLRTPRSAMAVTIVRSWNVRQKMVRRFRPALTIVRRSDHGHSRGHDLFSLSLSPTEKVRAAYGLQGRRRRLEGRRGEGGVTSDVFGNIRSSLHS
jgi:hypothetical protein